MNAKYHNRILFIVLCSIVSACRVSGLVFQLSALNWTSSSTHALTVDIFGQNIEAEVRYLAQQPRIQFSEAKLVKALVVVRGQERSSNIGDFQQIRLTFRTGGPPAAYGLNKYFFVRNLPPRHWGDWTRPRFGSQGTALDVYGEIVWSRVQSSMSLQRADTLLKAVGYRGDFRAVQIAETQDEPLGFCFRELEVLPGINRAVIVDVLTGVVRQLAFSTCP